jgi:hypothetical protein
MDEVRMHDVGARSPHHADQIAQAPEIDVRTETHGVHGNARSGQPCREILLRLAHGVPAIVAKGDH